MFTPRITFGEFPPRLYRAFKEEKFAVDLVERGSVRLGLLDHYKECEDQQRRDPSEGEGSLWVAGDVTRIAVSEALAPVREWQEPGHIHLQTSVANPVYIYCCSYPPDGDETLLPAKFGNHIVCIHDPIRFGQDLTDFLTTHPIQHLRAMLECARVTYDKGQVGPGALATEQRHRLSFSQKPEKFSLEYEYRLVAIVELGRNPRGQPLGKWLDIHLGKKLSSAYPVYSTNPYSCGYPAARFRYGHYLLGVVE